MPRLDGPLPGASTTEIGGVTIDEVAAGQVRVKRVTYPPGWRWRTHMQPVTGTDWCTHTHVGFVAQGTLGVEFSDGCTAEFSAPATLAVDPGHDGWVVGDEPVVFIQFDSAGDTAARFGLPAQHGHP